MQLVPTTLSVQPVSSEASDLLSCPDRASFAESSSSAPNRGNYRTATHFSLQASEHSGSGLSFSSRSSLSKEKHLTAPVIPPSKPLEKVRQDWVYAQAAAYQDAMNSKYSNRYKREESKITSWENQQKIKASLRMRKVEVCLFSYLLPLRHFRNACDSNLAY
ncbi:hypothetical protein KP509_06G000500 [Ceratopteris richardii]|uniref:Remorin C-terminal domain-containing protein n=1 Tax=Ceratopteris richardii TaxID=49495 RepID=A0A8T2UCX9_CERRI|nr:hypothetical protein KP509_06G000500 [Ceratopteris richardii]